MNLKKCVLLIVCLLVSVINRSFGQTGALDNTFGTGGIVTTSPGNDFIQGQSVALQSDGKILVAGNFSFDDISFEFALMRYNTDGSVDSTFGVNGLDTISIDSFNDVAGAIAIQPNGEIVVAGSSQDTANDQFALVRYTQSGQLDTTFGTNGKTTTSFGTTSDDGNSMAILPDGRIIMAGSASYYDSSTQIALARYTVNGLLDSTFGVNGEVTTIIYGLDDEAYSVAIQNDGKTVVAGTTYDSLNYEFAVVRYDSTGMLDTLFGNKGKVVTNIDSNGDFANSVVLQSNGQIVTAGRTFNNESNAYMFATVRYNTDGSLDNTFASGGIDTTAIGGFDDEAQSVVIQPADGKIVVAGFAEISGFDNFAVVRYNTDGSLDTSSNGGNGKVTTAIDSVSTGEGVVIQPDGKIVVAGYSQNYASLYNNIAIARYLTSLTLGIIDLSKANNSLFVYPNPLQDEAVLDYTLANEETLSISIYNITGQQMQSVITNKTTSKGEHSQTINLQSLPAGMYLISLANSSSQSIYIKIIKQ